MDTQIRAMRPEDAQAAATMWASTMAALQASLGEEPRHHDEPAHARLAARFRFMVGTDPDGSFVADQRGRLSGLAVSHLRGEWFMLANLGVAPEDQDQGIGRHLLGRVLDYAASAPAAMICSSPDPRALHRYVRAGFHASPAMEAIGRPSGGAASLPSFRRSQAGAADLAIVDDLDLHVRGVRRTGDLQFLLGAGNELWIDDDGAYALVRDGELTTACASDDRLGRRMLGALLSGQATGRPTTARWLTASTPWAFAAAVDAGATLRGRGAVMTRGEVHHAGAYLPSGVFG